MITSPTLHHKVQEAYEQCVDQLRFEEPAFDEHNDERDGARLTRHLYSLVETEDCWTVFETRIYNGLLEALTSEYASRRFAMKNATDAASDMQKELKGIYNRKRQEGITKELLDIVGGSEAVK